MHEEFSRCSLTKYFEYGLLWCDKGVNRIAKEIQLLKADEFKNIFLGLGGFHTEKIIRGCCGQYLKESGIDTVLAENKIFGIDLVKSVINGKYYSRGKRGIMLISEALLQIMLCEFWKESNEKQQNFQQLYQEVETLQNVIVNNIENDDLIKKVWEKCEQLSDQYVTSLNEFISQGNRRSHLFKYWSNFLINVVTILRDFAMSFRQANWLKHIQALRRAIPYFYAYDRINYKRWAALYYEDCLALPNKFLKLYITFCKGDFVVTQTFRKSSSISLDQALEMQYNNPASQSGIIGITRKKEAVNKWNILRHEKLQDTQFLEQMCYISNNDEYSLRHEFSASVTENDREAVSNIIDYINEHVNPFRMDKNTLVNLATGVKFDTCSSEFFINCLQIGDEHYQNFKMNRLVNKTEELFDSIHKVRSNQSHKAVSKSEAIKKETVTFMKYVDFARVLKYDLKKLIKYDI